MKYLFKQIYAIIPFKKYIFLCLKALFSPSKNIFQHLHFIGNFKVKVSKDNSFKIRHYGYQIENEIFWQGVFGGWEKISMRIWAELCQNANMICDVGANTGVYSLLAKSVNPNAHVYAFEPLKKVYDKLEYNNQLNSFDIHCVCKALSDETGKTKIYDNNKEHMYSATVNKDIPPVSSDSFLVEIDIIKLDDFMKNHSLKQFDLLKIDVELHEVEVLEGYKENFKVSKPSMLIEILTDEIAKGVENIIKDLGYEYYVIDESSGVKKVNTLQKIDHYNYLIIQPEKAKPLKCIKELELKYKN